VWHVHRAARVILDFKHGNAMKNLLLTHRRLGLFYVVFGAMAACVGSLIAVLLRMELHAPGLQFITNRLLFNTLTTGHGLILPLSGTIPLLFCGCQ
jgi:cytochrome c oxidase subunit I